MMTSAVMETDVLDGEIPGQTWPIKGGTCAIGGLLAITCGENYGLRSLWSAAKELAMPTSKKTKTGRKRAKFVVGKAWDQLNSEFERVLERGIKNWAKWADKNDAFHPTGATSITKLKACLRRSFDKW
jgi:hypothetical protein